jgi:hypothetical protein
MQKARAVVVGATFAALIVVSSAEGATDPEPGRYLANIFVAEVHGVECPDHLGADYQGVVRYQGIDGTRLTIRIPVVFDGYPVIDQQILTVTTGAGTLTPRGKFSVHLSAPIDFRITGSFHARLRLSDDPQSFTATVTETAPLISCTEVFRIGLVRSG